MSNLEAALGDIRTTIRDNHIMVMERLDKIDEKYDRKYGETSTSVAAIEARCAERHKGQGGINQLSIDRQGYSDANSEFEASIKLGKAAWKKVAMYAAPALVALGAAVKLFIASQGAVANEKSGDRVSQPSVAKPHSSRDSVECNPWGDRQRHQHLDAAPR